MRFLAFLVPLLWLSTEGFGGGWAVREREPLKAAPGVDFARVEVTGGGASAELHVVAVRSSTHTFAVVDDATGGQRVATVGAGTGAVAAVNGGYFTPEHTPLGLVVSGGKTLHPWQRAPLLSGMAVAGEGRVSLLRAKEYKPGAAPREALQAGPFLIDGGTPVPGLNATRSAARTVVFTASGGAFGVLVCHSATLAATAEILATPELLPGLKLLRALNLDGGSSTGMWVRGEPAPFTLREWKNVRTYLTIMPR